MNLSKLKNGMLKLRNQRENDLLLHDYKFVSKQQQATFHSLGIVIATIMGVIFLHDDTFYLGSLVGSIIIVIGFYSVMWGKAKEMKVVDNSGLNSLEPGNENAPLLIAKDAN